VAAADSDPVLLPLRAAMEARDLTAAVDCFAPGAVLRSPFTDKLAFTGRDQIRTLIAVLFEVFEDLRYTGEARTGNHAFLVARARIAGQDVEIADHVLLRPDGAIEEFTVFFRPLPAAAAALRAITAGLVRRKSAARGAAMVALTSPLAVMTRAGDGVGVSLVRSAL
jgi:hypothetical protein